MKICVVTDGYPTPNNPGMLVFVDQLVTAWAEMGIDMSVICPVPYFVEFFDKGRFYKNKWEKKTNSGKIINIYSPRFFRVSDKKLGCINTQKISYQSFQQAVIKTIQKFTKKPDVLYSHFLPSGCHAGDVGKKLSIPAFCAFGESSLWSISGWDMDNVRNSLDKLSGIISVSTNNKNVLVENNLFRDKDIEVFPNGVDHTLFYRRNKKETREKYGFPEDAFIGAFTGSFSDNKGVLRAQEAAIRAGNTQMIFIGGGTSEPKGSNIIFSGKLRHDCIPEYLSAADFFILPTKAEGCCNAIVEAMSCGLPIISSSWAYNDDILEDSYSLRTDPCDIDAMAKDISFLREHPQKREMMAQEAEKASHNFDIRKRAERILQYMNRKTM